MVIKEDIKGSHIKKGVRLGVGGFAEVFRLDIVKHLKSCTSSKNILVIQLSVSCTAIYSLICMAANIIKTRERVVTKCKKTIETKNCLNLSETMLKAQIIEMLELYILLFIES